MAWGAKFAMGPLTKTPQDSKKHRETTFVGWLKRCFLEQAKNEPPAQQVDGFPAYPLSKSEKLIVGINLIIWGVVAAILLFGKFN